MNTMNTPIKATEVAPMIYQMLVNVVNEEYEGESESVKQEAIFDILMALNVQMFK